MQAVPATLHLFLVAEAAWVTEQVGRATLSNAADRQNHVWGLKVSSFPPFLSALNEL